MAFLFFNILILGSSIAVAFGIATVCRFVTVSAKAFVLLEAASASGLVVQGVVQ